MEKALQKSNEELERKVAERTAELTEANEILRKELQDRRKAEETLRESEDWYGDLVEYSQYLICTHDMEGRILSANRGAVKLLGFDHDLLLKMNIRDLLVPEFKDEFDDYLTMVRKENAPEGMMKVITRAGDRRILAYKITVRTEGVSLPIVRAIAHDVTEMLKTEKALKRLSQENAIIAEIGRTISSTLKIEDVYDRFAEEVRKLIPFDRISVTTMNPETLTITPSYVAGLQIGGRSPGDVFPVSTSPIYQEMIVRRGGILIQSENEKDLTEDYPSMAHFFRAGIRSFMSVPLISKDQPIGGLHFHSLKPKAYTEMDLHLAERVGNQVAGAIANARLFAARKRAEEALKASEEKFRELYDNAPVGYHEYDAEGLITNVNVTDLEMLGYTREEMIGRFMWDFNAEEEIAKEQILEKLTGLRPPGENLERLYRRKDGTTFPVFIKDRLILDEKGRISGIRCAVQDITERKRAEESLRKTEEQLRQSQKMEAVGKLAGGIAHDFNNLLTVIRGYSEVLLTDLDEIDPFRQDILEIKNAADRAATLTFQLLAFSRKQILQPKILNINSLVSNMDKMLRRLIGEDIDLVTLLAGDLGTVKVDPGQIEQVILNLAINARDVMPKGGKLTIETANVELDENYAGKHISVKPGRYILLAVSDTGVGMSQEVKERAFEPFFTTKEKGKGTGLGLSTVYGIMKQSDGYIWIYSEPGKGTTIKLHLPITQETSEPPLGGEKSMKSPSGSETILLVEDEEMVRKLTRSVLRKKGYHVIVAANGEEALRIVQQQGHEPIHLVLTDVVMPGMSGPELADRLETLKPGMKILFMSGYTDNAIVHHGVLDPGTAYINKPFTIDALAVKVREVLKTH